MRDAAQSRMAKRVTKLDNRKQTEKKMFLINTRGIISVLSSTINPKILGECLGTLKIMISFNRITRCCVEGQHDVAWKVNTSEIEKFTLVIYSVMS